MFMKLTELAEVNGLIIGSSDFLSVLHYPMKNCVPADIRVAS